MIEIAPFNISLVTKTPQIDNEVLLQVTDVYLNNVFQQKTDPELNFRKVVLNYLSNPNRRLVAQSTFSMTGNAYFLTKATINNETIHSIVEEAFTDYSDYYLAYLDSTGIQVISMTFQWFSHSNANTNTKSNNAVIAIATIGVSAALVSLATGVYLLRSRLRRTQEEEPKIQKEPSEKNPDRIIDCPDTFSVVSELTYEHRESKSIVTGSVYTLPTNDQSKLKVIDEKELKDDHTTSNDTFDRLYDCEM